MMHTISSLAYILGVHTKTIEKWEDRGIIPEPLHRTSSGHRLYSEQEVEQIKPIAAQRREAYMKQQAGE